LVAEALGTTLGRIAASVDPLPERALALLTALRPAVPFDAAWLAFSDPRRSRYVSLASVDLDDDITAFFSGPVMAHDIAATGSDRDRLPVSRSDRSYRTSEQLSIWSDCLTPAGIHESLSVALFARGGRYVGFLILLSRSASPSSRTTRRRLAALAPALALGIDPMPCLLSTARLVRGVTAGTVLRDDGLTEALPGLDGDQLLAVGSPVLAIACRRLGDGLPYSSFLWPLGGAFAPEGHARITVVAAPDDVPAVLAGMALVSPAHDLHGLTPRELEVLGLVIDGCSNQEIAHALVVAPRTVAAHIEHLLIKLHVTTRTTAAVRAEREGLYVPTVLGSSYEGRGCGERES
jgi:DNA-binding CsgD family transcriptional regulator